MVVVHLDAVVVVDDVVVRKVIFGVGTVQRHRQRKILSCDDPRLQRHFDDDSC